MTYTDYDCNTDTLVTNVVPEDLNEPEQIVLESVPDFTGLVFCQPQCD